MREVINTMLDRVHCYVDIIRIESSEFSTVNLKGCEAVLKIRDVLRILNSALDDVRVAKNQEVERANKPNVG